jgi:hypothetical protein
MHTERMFMLGGLGLKGIFFLVLLFLCLPGSAFAGRRKTADLDPRVRDVRIILWLEVFGPGILVQYYQEPQRRNTVPVRRRIQVSTPV